MAQPYVGEIRMFAGNFPPNGWMFCEGQALPISENETLFVVIGTTYGGDGQSTFNLPNLASRFPLHQGTGSFGTTYQIGQAAGVESVTLTTQQIPAHNHAFLTSTGPGNINTPAGSVTSQSAAVKIYLEDSTSVAMNAAAINPTGGSQPHENMQPYLCVNFIISLFGIFPSQTWERIVADPFVAEIRIFPSNFAPKGWAFCDGQLLPLSQNTALFSLLGTFYGGNGVSNFALPDLQGRAPMQPGQGQGLSQRFLGEQSGTEFVTLLESEMPAHNHSLRAAVDPSNVQIPTATVVPSRSAGGNAYNPSNAGLQTMAFQTLSVAGGSQPHNNMQPYLTLNFNIALQGVYPARP